MSAVAVGDIVHLVEDTNYLVKKLFPDGRTCLLQKVNGNLPRFRRFLSQLWVPPPSTTDVSASANFPTANCLCPDPVAPPIKSDVEIQVDRDEQQAMDEWCSLMTDFSSVDRLQTAFNEAREEARRYFGLCSEAHEQITSLKQALLNLEADKEAELNKLRTAHLQAVADLQKETDDIRVTYGDLRATHDQLMRESLDRIEELTSLRTQLANCDNSSQQALLRLVRSHLLSLPCDFGGAWTPDDTFTTSCVAVPWPTWIPLVTMPKPS